MTLGCDGTVFPAEFIAQPTHLNASDIPRESHCGAPMTSSEWFGRMQALGTLMESRGGVERRGRRWRVVLSALLTTVVTGIANGCGESSMPNGSGAPLPEDVETTTLEPEARASPRDNPRIAGDRPVVPQPLPEHDPQREQAADTSTTSATVLAPGIEFSDASEVCEALRDLARGWEVSEIPEKLRDFVPTRGVLRIPPNRLASECGSSISFAFVPECGGFSCDANLEQCHGGETLVLLREGARGRYLHTVASFPDAAPAQASGNVARIVERRDRVCELYEGVKTGRISQVANRYRRALAMSEGPKVLSGQRAIRAARQDVNMFRAFVPNLACTQRYCMMDLASNEAELAGYLRAQRTPNGYQLEGRDDSAVGVVSGFR